MSHPPGLYRPDFTGNRRPQQAVGRLMPFSVLLPMVRHFSMTRAVSLRVSVLPSLACEV